MGHLAPLLAPVQLGEGLLGVPHRHLIAPIHVHVLLTVLANGAHLQIPETIHFIVIRVTNIKEECKFLQPFKCSCIPHFTRKAESYYINKNQGCYKHKHSDISI